MPTRRECLKASASVPITGLAGGCLSEFECSNRTHLSLEPDPQPPKYRDELNPIQFEALPEDEKDLVNRSLRENEENVEVTVCTEKNPAIRNFTHRVRSALNEQGVTPWGGYPIVFIIKDKHWYSIRLKVNRTIVSK